MKKILIIGGGLGGLITAILLARKGFEVQLFEKKKYPFHRVCGEYISNEVKDFLIRNQLYPEVEVADINRFMYSATNGDNHSIPLDLGAFGVSRFHLDHHLVQIAKHEGIVVNEGVSITSVKKSSASFEVTDNSGRTHQSHIVVGAFGKSSNLDRTLDRKFLNKESPFIGVKYHIRIDFPKDLIALHNFESGYCGISAIEDDKYNLCYLGKRSVLKAYGSIPDMEEAVLHQNPFLKEIFSNSEFLFDKPEVINAFSFEPKKPVEQDIFMVGDAAGLITPLCGNGMAMAIHSAKILSDLLIENQNADLPFLQKAYSQKWKSHFEKRLWVGRQTQRLFGTGSSSKLAVKLMKSSSLIARNIMKNTHGQPF